MSASMCRGGMCFADFVFMKRLILICVDVFFFLFVSMETELSHVRMTNRPREPHDVRKTEPEKSTACF